MFDSQPQEEYPVGMTHNILESPLDGTFTAELEHRIARLVAEDERSFPVHPNAEASTHPMWKAYGEWADIVRARQNGETDGLRIVAVTSVREVSWSEFEDTVAGNSEHGGFVADVERADGWKGRYSLEISFGDAIAALRAGGEPYVERLEKALVAQREAYYNSYDFNKASMLDDVRNALRDAAYGSTGVDGTPAKAGDVHAALARYIEHMLSGGHRGRMTPADREAYEEARDILTRVRFAAEQDGRF